MSKKPAKTRRLKPRVAPRRQAASKAAPKPTAKTAKGTWVYAFGGGKAEGKPGMRNLLGGKGAGLAEMASLGLPVPPGFTITTDVCTFLLRQQAAISEGR